MEGQRSTDQPGGKVTAAMIQAARHAAFEYKHPGKKMTDVAWVGPEIGLVKAMLEAALRLAE